MIPIFENGKVLTREDETEIRNFLTRITSPFQARKKFEEVSAALASIASDLHQENYPSRISFRSHTESDRQLLIKNVEVLRRYLDCAEAISALPSVEKAQELLQKVSPTSPFYLQIAVVADELSIHGKYEGPDHSGSGEVF